MRKKKTQKTIPDPGAVTRQDVIRRLAELAFGRANDCVRLVLEPQPEVEALELSLLSEVKRSEKGTVEVRLIDRLAVLAHLERCLQGESGTAEAFLRSLQEGSGE